MEVDCMTCQETPEARRCIRSVRENQRAFVLWIIIAPDRATLVCEWCALFGLREIM